MSAALSTPLGECRQEVLDEWTRRVLDDPKVPEANRLSAPALLDHVPAILDRISFTVEAAEDGGEATARELDVGPSAEAHGRDRFARKYTLKEALRELSHLRAAILAVCARRAVPLEGARAQALHAAFDEIMSTVAIEMEQAARADKALERERLRLVLELLPVGVFIADAEGRILAANPAAERIWGGRPLPFPECKDYNLYQGWWPATGEPVAPGEWALARALRHGEARLDEEVEILGFDGKRRTIVNSALPLRDASGALVGGVAVNVDITDRKHAEQELRRDAEFRERFLGILGHDLRTPLTSILLSAATLQRREDLPAPLQTPIKRIVTSGERMARMINQLLDLTRISGGGLPVQRRQADLSAIARQVIDEIEGTVPDRSIAVDHRGDLCGSWDPDRLAQVVSNLVSNAIDHSPAGTPVRVALWGNREDVHLEIHNLGPPIPPEMLGVIFEPYRRAAQDSTARSQAARGLGLGLFIVRQIVLAHGGSIDVRSSEGEGTTFTVRLPRSP